MKKKKTFSFLILFMFLLLINLSEENIVSNIKKNLRSLWDETIRYDTTYRNSDEKESIEHCKDSDYKYFIHYVAGQNYTFNQFINKDNAVRYFNFYFLLSIETSYKYIKK